MRALTQPVQMSVETDATTSPQHSIMPPLIAAILLAVGGATDAVATIANGKGLLAETGLSTEGQLGFSIIFLVGFCYAAKRLESIHKERIDEWKKRYEDEHAEKIDLIKRLREREDDGR